MNLRNKLIKSTIIMFGTAGILTLTACSNTKYNEFLKAINNKETAIIAIGSENCLHCQLLKKQWKLWEEQENWKEGIVATDNDFDGLNNLKRYNFTEPYRKDGLTTFSKLSWVKNINKWLKEQSKALSKNNQELKNAGIGNHIYDDNGIPLIIFIKNGEFRWWLSGWGDVTQNEKDDLTLSKEEFTNGQASWNVSTLKRITKDFIFGNFSDFYKEIKSGSGNPEAKKE